MCGRNLRLRCRRWWCDESRGFIVGMAVHCVPRRFYIRNFSFKWLRDRKGDECYACLCKSRIMTMFGWHYSCELGSAIEGQFIRYPECREHLIQSTTKTYLCSVAGFSSTGQYFFALSIDNESLLAVLGVTSSCTRSPGRET